MAFPDCIDDGNGLGWSIECEADTNGYDASDIKDLTLANIGEAGRETALNMAFIVALLVIIFIVGVILVLKKRAGVFAQK